jgi:hypothetical protein
MDNTLAPAPPARFALDQILSSLFAARSGRLVAETAAA